MGHYENIKITYFKTKYQKQIPVTNAAGKTDDFKEKLNKMYAAGAPGTYQKGKV